MRDFFSIGPNDRYWSSYAIFHKKGANGLPFCVPFQGISSVLRTARLLYRRGRENLATLPCEQEMQTRSKAAKMPQGLSDRDLESPVDGHYS